MSSTSITALPSYPESTHCGVYCGEHQFEKCLAHVYHSALPLYPESTHCRVYCGEHQFEKCLAHVYHCPTLVPRKHPLRCVLWGIPTWNTWSAWRGRCWWNPHVSVSAATLRHPGTFPLKCRWSDSRWNQTQCKNQTAHPGQRFTEHKPTHWSVPAPTKQGN